MKLRQFDSTEPLGEMEDGERYFLSTPMPYGMSFHDAQRLADKLLQHIAEIEPAMTTEEGELCCEWDRCHGHAIYAFDPHRPLPAHISSNPPHDGWVPHPRT